MDTPRTPLEDFLKLVWTRSLYPDAPTDREGNPVTVLSPGQPNPDERGPELTGVSVRIGQSTHTGPAAIHCNASDWHKHAHHIDPLYDGCVLHIVLNDDAAICRTDGSLLPCIVIGYPEQTGALYNQLTGESATYKCGRILSDMPSIRRCEIITRLAVERLERKCNDFLELYTKTGHDWNEVFYIMLFRYMGGKSNQEAYTKLARTIHFRDICRIRESTLATEALLLGGAGWLDDVPESPYDAYALSLQQEFDHLRRRFGIRPMRMREWSFNDNYPGGHPVVRIVELAALLSSGEFLFSKLLNSRSPDEVRRILSAQASEYWDRHYRPGRFGKFQPKQIGDTMKDILCINVVVPMIFTHGQISGNEEEKERALELLEKIPPETNTFTKGWKAQGVAADNAFFSQGLIQLSSEYCRRKRCASCNIGEILLCSR